MIKLSAAGQEAFDADIGILHMQAAINLNSRFGDDSVTVTVLAGGDYFGTADQVYNDRTTAPFKRWHLGESKLGEEHGLIDGSVECGWTTEVISDIDGSFPINPAIEETFKLRTIYNIRVYGDDAWDDYPVNFSVELYYGGSYHTEVNVTDNEEVDFFYTLPIEREGVTKAKLTITKWSQEIRPCKIYEFFAGRMILYGDDDIYNFHIIEEDTGEDYESLPLGLISANRMSVVFHDDGILPGIIIRNALLNFVLTAEKNGVYYPVDMGGAYIKEWQPNSENETFEVAGMDVASVTAEDDYTANVQKNKSAYDWLSAIMSASRIPESMYWIDPEFNDFIIPVGLFNLTRQMKAIGQIIGLTLGSCYINRATGMLEIKGPKKTASNGVSLKTFTNEKHVMPGTNEPVEINELYTVFEISYHEIVIAASAANVIESKENITIEGGRREEIILKYPRDVLSVDEVSAPSITQTGTGLSIADWKAYVDHISITINNSSTSLQTVTSVTVSGKPVTDIVHKYMTENTDAIADYGRIVFDYDNLLVQSYARAKAIGDALKSQYSNAGGKIVNTLWGAPYLLVGDTITVPDKNQENKIVQVKRQEFMGGSEIAFQHPVTSRKVS